MRTALLNMKPGTGKTTSTAFLVSALADAGATVLAVDADPGRSLTRWSEGAGGFHSHVTLVGLPTRSIGHELDNLLRRRPVDAVVIDTPQMEDHAPICRAAMAWVAKDPGGRGTWLVPLAPAEIELERMIEVETVMDEVDAFVPGAHRSVLLNRCNTPNRTKGGDDAQMAEALVARGWHVQPVQAAWHDLVYRKTNGQRLDTATLARTPFPELVHLLTDDYVGPNSEAAAHG